MAIINTEYLNLQKPDDSEKVSQTCFNSNADIIDAKIKTIDQNISSINTTNTSNLSTINGKITTINNTTINGHKIADGNITLSAIDISGVVKLPAGSTITTISSWALETQKPSYKFTELSGAFNVSYFTNDAGYITATSLPTKISQLTNDSNFITMAQVEAKGYLLSSSIADWAKEPTRPTYTAAQVGARENTWVPTIADIAGLQTTLTSLQNAINDLTDRVAALENPVTP